MLPLTNRINMRQVVNEVPLANINCYLSKQANNLCILILDANGCTLCITLTTYNNKIIN